MSYWQRDCTAADVQILLFKNLQLLSLIASFNSMYLQLLSSFDWEWTLWYFSWRLHPDLTCFWPSLGAGKFCGFIFKRDGRWQMATCFILWWSIFFFVNMLPSNVVPCQKHWRLAKTANPANCTVYDPLYRTFLESWSSFLTLSNFTICWSPPYVKPPLLEVKRFPNGGN